MIALGFTKFLFCVIFFVFLSLSSAKNYDVKWKAVYCYEIDPNFVYNVTCRVRAVRGKQGVMDKIFYYRNNSMVDVWVRRKNYSFILIVELTL